MLWEAVDQQSPPPDESEDLTKFGWEIRDGTLTPIITQDDLGPPFLRDVRFIASVWQKRKKYSTEITHLKNVKTHIC